MLSGASGSGDQSTTRDVVELRLPAESAYLSVLRTATAGLAARLDFTLDEIEDLRIAVDEACAMLLPDVVVGSPLTCRFVLDWDCLEVSVLASCRSGRPPATDSFAWTVLTALAGEVESSADNGIVTVTLRKRPGLVGVRVSDGLEPIPDARSAARARSRELFEELIDSEPGSTRHQAARDELVELHLPLVEHLARRFAGRGEPLDDLIQVGTIGLIKSVDRFDLERGVEFSTYATPTVVGEIKRHFRDKGWAVRVPRRLQELRLALSAANEELSHSLGRSPTVAEISARLGVSEEEVLEGLESANAYSTVSLDAGTESDDGPSAMLDVIGSDDDALEGVEYRESLRPLLAQLAPRERQILLLRFFRNMTQSQIADEVGISQMHVSRLLARTLAQLRTGLLEVD